MANNDEEVKRLLKKLWDYDEKIENCKAERLKNHWIKERMALQKEYDAKQEELLVAEFFQKRIKLQNDCKFTDKPIV